MGYPGGKSGSGVFQALINLMPPHTLYVEPFLGGGAVLRYKRPAALNIGIDLDPDVIASWSTSSGTGGPAAPPREALESAAVRSAGRARVTTGGGNGGAAGGDAIFGGGSRKLLPALESAATAASAKYSGADRQPSPLLAPADPDGENGGAVRDGGSGDSTRWHYLVADGIEFLRMNNRLLTPDALVYCDPPYLHSTRVCTRHYRHEMTDRQHEELLDVLRKLKCRVMISGYSSPMYARALRGWNATAFQASTRGKPAAEWVWYNFERPVELHDYRYLGDSKRERERIRRKQRRWANRLRVMPVLERQALLSAIAETAGNGDARSPTSISGGGGSTAAVFSGAAARSTRTPKAASLEENALK